jgi:hypothetical protein
MTTITCKPGCVIRDGSYPPDKVFVGFFNGEAQILKLDHPEEDIDDAIKQAAHLRKVGEAQGRRQVDRRQRISDT